ncbi:helix-turn-helix transcriptional regulator [Streptomyces sp. P9(2023)]|uniref:helix-turn-helix domain-containing protein n=1 Tax=Streptomyces sp. P9(2023) TaxID=3064394 RepID=UPI0028F43BE2|nr:helix-turn-helix transcriptional regulator [Streptomyces sp. P9(2023)]MDT9689159.1 helix-turn-helix transcriptional regulator [Streptomyces sp. P9(2023)]
MGRTKDPAVEEFARQVRTLKERSGRSYGALARRLNVSTSTLFRYCSGETVPERFTVIDRLARLCGATEEERRALHRLWTGADRIRRPPTPTPPPAPEPKTEPGPEPAPGPEPEPAPPAETPARRPRLRRAGPAAVAVAAAALALLTLGPSTPTTPTVPHTSAVPNTPTAPVTLAAKPTTTPAPPFTWTVASQVWKQGCGHTYLVDRGPDRVPPPPAAQDAAPWAGAQGAVHGGDTLVRVSLQGRSATEAVVLQALHVRVTGRAEPPAWNAYRMDNGCGGAVSPRHFDVNLDKPRPVARSVAGFDALVGEEGAPIPAVSLPYAITSTAPEELLVNARTAGCDCRWYLELEWSGAGRSGTVRIDDGGRPFRTSAIEGPVFEYDTLGRRWIPSP